MGRFAHLPTAKSGGVFVGVAALWLVIDQLTKAYFEDAYALGQMSEASYGLFRFRLVHNTGMAWGLFGDSTFALGVISLVVCAAIVALFACYRSFAGHAATTVETCALALVFSGGLGNAIDRFAQAYVVDFIDLTFIDFPVFNVADIGVTCGFVLLVAGYLWASRNDGFLCGNSAACVGDSADDAGCDAGARHTEPAAPTETAGDACEANDGNRRSS
ncbi:MAG: signal peptidase II [Slackia sp.]|nr:signal peptidase II [Slackia sp.]